MSGQSTVSAKSILELLAVRHWLDVFVAECKDGPSQFCGHLRLDAWALKKSWSHPLATGYEIKVSHSDFVADDKWRGYLPYCNEFYFVCPAGLIQPDELPVDAGLIFVSRTGTKLFRKKKPRYRSVEIPESLYRYILFARAKIVATRYYPAAGEESSAEFWKGWLATKGSLEEVGWRVSKRLRELIETRITKAELKNEQLERQNTRLAQGAAVLESLGVGLQSWRAMRDQVGERLAEFKRIVPSRFEQSIRTAETAVREMLEFVVEFRGNSDGDGGH